MPFRSERLSEPKKWFVAITLLPNSIWPLVSARAGRRESGEPDRNEHGDAFEQGIRQAAATDDRREARDGRAR